MNLDALWQRNRKFILGTVGAARVGRSIELALEAATEAEAREAARRMCERLLANPVTEDFTLDAVEPAA